VLATITLAYMAILLPNSTFGQLPQKLYNHTLYEIVKQSSGQDENSQIVVGSDPDAIAISERTNSVYVVNSGSDSVSVISGENNTKIKDIPVGDNPTAVGVSRVTGTLYVVNHNSDTISVIDTKTNKVVAGIIFKINSFNSGYILCDGLSTPSPTEQYFFVYSGAQCIAKPNSGFEFSSWEQNLEGNSTQPISVSRPASSLDSFLEFLHLKSEDKPEATLNVTEFGTFTANFKELPPAVPSEYWIPLYGIIASTIVGWSIPSIIGWTKSKRDVLKLNSYHKEIARLDDDGRLDEEDIEALDELRKDIGNAYSEGKINEKHYETLRDEISTLYEEIFRKKIAALDNGNKYSVVKKPVQEQLGQMRDEVELAFSKGKINEKHFDLLTKAISNLSSKKANNTP
jgi:YVTN family beta-propeller protein